MKLFEQIERLNFIHKLIKNGTTGSPELFAEKLKVSKRQLYNILDDLKILGAPIYYDSHICSYRYEQEFFLKIDINIKLITEKEQIDTNGGFFNQSEILFHPIHLI